MDLFALLNGYGYLALATLVFAEQIGLPLPAMPILLAAGALSARGDLWLPLAFLIATVAAVVADSAWHWAGRSHGASLTEALFHGTKHREYLRRSETMIAAKGPGILLVAKFVPGLNAFTAPLMGIARVSFRKFLLADLIGTMLWAGTFLGAGYFGHELLTKLLQILVQPWVIASAVMALALFAAFKSKVSLRPVRFARLRRC